MNYGVYLVTDTNAPDFNPGDQGVFKTNMGPGIRECPYGNMYIAPEKWINNRIQQDGRNPDSITASSMAAYIYQYFKTT
jgi:hypothetical protein